MNVERLLRTADALDALAKNGPAADAIAKIDVFTMDVFFDESFTDEDVPWLNPDRKKDTATGVTCGTAACAVGYIATLPAFIADGWNLQKIRFAETWNNIDVYFDFTDADQQLAAKLGDADAVLRCTETAGRYLFSPYAYLGTARTDPTVVANRIRAFVEHARLNPSIPTES